MYRIYVDLDGCLTVLGSPDGGRLGEGMTREESMVVARTILDWSSGPTVPAAPPPEPAPPSPREP